MASDANDDEIQTPSMWSTEYPDGEDTLAEECSPTKVCRNAREFSFDGIAADGGDLKSAWRDKLQREGKFNASAQSLGDLVLSHSASD